MIDKPHLLCYSYYWPPSGKASLHLPLHLLRGLIQQGWSVTVVTVADDDFTTKDYSLLHELPNGITILRTFSLEPFTIYRKFLGKDPKKPIAPSETISKENKGLRHKLAVWIRMNLFIPDARVGWFPFAYLAAAKYHKTHPIDIVLSFGPPHSTHLASLILKTFHAIPFVPFFIDPWMDIIYYREFIRSKLTLFIDGWLEKTVLRHAAHSVFVTETMTRDYLNKYKEIQGKTALIHWGYNELAFEGTESLDVQRATMLHSGNIFDYQDPKALWGYLQKRKQNGNPIKLKFSGTVSPQVKKSITSHGLDEDVTYLGFLPYKEMIKEMMQAEFLLVCVTEPRHVPGKLFEYLRSGRPILCFGENNQEVASILKEQKAGEIFRYNENPESFFSNADLYVQNRQTIDRYERNNLARKLGHILSSYIKGKKGE